MILQDEHANIARHPTIIWITTRDCISVLKDFHTASSIVMGIFSSIMGLISHLMTLSDMHS